ncbi:hypothetical protein THASP1DRAFT_28952 [Thamnocephalis sphaerospora]|uniref:F-box domain-containing protein n=1 Tax=Thamnocephalis sphaerospora TaxID=78915 RepID=A0A4P9XSZ2_9FUNG|nr:hypothetical protein THASP1DRAFT_28952 [Thamnocephalis sphaerospora]|eukprot:RKP09246.1 hypothetical protein THASP1DRAFT_28952 [Thamnocephalis sphaerospora]
MMDARSAGSMQTVSAATTASSAGGNGQPGALAPRKNIRQPDMGLELERRVARRRKTKDDFELDNAGTSTTAASSTSAASSSSGAGIAGAAPSGQATAVAGAGVAPTHAQDDLSATGLGSMSSAMRPPTRSSTVIERDAAAARIAASMAVSADADMASASTADRLYGDAAHGMLIHGVGVCITGSSSSSSLASAHVPGHNSSHSMALPAVSTSHLVSQFVDASSSAASSSTVGSGGNGSGNSCSGSSSGGAANNGAGAASINPTPASAGPSTPAIHFVPGPLDITHATQLPPQRFALCPSPTYFALDQGGSPMSFSLYSANGSSTPHTPVFEDLPRSPYPLSSPSVSRSASNASLASAMSPAQRSPSHASSPLLSPASPALYPFAYSHDMQPRLPGVTMAARTTSAREDHATLGSIGFASIAGTVTARPSPLALATTMSPTFMELDSDSGAAVSGTPVEDRADATECHAYGGNEPRCQSDPVRAIEFGGDGDVTMEYVAAEADATLTATTTATSTANTTTPTLHLAPVDRCPVEVMLTILSYLPCSVQRQCAVVSRRWHALASHTMLRSPVLITLHAFERLVDTVVAGNTALTGDEQTVAMPTPLAGVDTATAQLAVALASSTAVDSSSSDNDNSNNSSSSSTTPLLSSPSSEPVNVAVSMVASTTSASRQARPNACAHLVRRLNLARMDEQYRCAPGLSRQLTRAAPYLRHSLRALDLGFCKGARNYDLQRLAPLLHNLTYLNLAGGGRTDIVVSKIAKHCPRLLQLSVAWNASVSDFGCAEIARWCPRLRKLDLTSCGGITDAGVIAVVDGCRDLRVLGVAYCSGVGDIAVRDAATRLPRLHWLGVAGCSGVSRACLRDCDQARPGLVVVRPGELPFERDTI